MSIPHCGDISSPSAPGTAIALFSPVADVGQQALDRAIDGETELVLLYQPIHVLRGGAIYGAEALLRQRRRSGEIREASVIAEAAEESAGPELYVLDAMIVKQAYTDAAQWQARFPDVRLNVNLSPREFQEGNVIDRLTGLVSACGIDTRKVNLEITETSYIEDPQKTTRVLDALDDLGVGVWLDDFGTGHSSITHLQHFDVDGIKIPGTFINGIANDRRCAAIVRSLLSLAHDLGIAVIAEGVETREQLELLRELDCEYVQGFLFNKPMTAAAFEDLLQR
jgi:EAL domain-containing protein (putative c-di-GMP-specific phosphodiesterase class I)